MTLVKQPFICLHVCTTYFSGIYTTIYEDIDKKIHNTFVLYTAYRIYFIREKNDSYEYIYTTTRTASKSLIELVDNK